MNRNASPKGGRRASRMLAVAALAMAASILVIGTVQLDTPSEPVRQGSEVPVPALVQMPGSTLEIELVAPADLTGTTPEALASPPLVTTSPLAPTGRLAGRIVDEHGRPQDGATVLVHELTRGAPRSLLGFHRCIAREPAQDDGSFETAPLPAGKPLILSIEVGRRPSGDFKGFMTIAGRRLDVGDLMVPGPVTITGRVEDEEGRPLSGARVVGGRSFGHELHRAVSALRQGEPHDLWLSTVAITDGEGAYVLADLPANELRVGAMSPGLAEDWTTVFARHGPDEIPVLKLGKWRRVSGRVVHHDGHPAARSLVTVTVEDLPGTFPAVTADDDGRFSILCPAKARATLHARGERPGAHNSLSLSPFVDEVEVRLEAPLPEMRLRAVQVDGTPVASFQAWWFAPDTPGPLDLFALPDDMCLLGTSTGTDGMLVVPRPEEGLIFVSARGRPSRLVPVPGLDEMSPLAIVVEDDQPVSGVVIDGETGLPVAGAELHVVLERSRQGVPGASGWSDESGCFRFSSLPLSTLRLIATAADHLRVETILALTDRGNLRVVLPPAGTLDITVEAASRSRCTPPYTIRIKDSAGKIAWQESNLLARCVAGPLAPGRYVVRAEGLLGALETAVSVEPGRVSTVSLSRE
jgi:hypothetical protein